jgi:tetratricopeptide (TPR) repeat protein
MANEPLAEQEIITFLRLRDRIPNGEAGDKLVVKGLAAIASMLRRAPDPEGEDGYMLHHLSLREHILTTETMSYPVEQARKAFAKAAMSPDDEKSISNYLYRTGVDHLLSNNQVDDAREKLLDLEYLGKMFNLGKQNLDILQYWLKIGDDDQGKVYIEAVNEYMERELKEKHLDILEEFLQLCAVSGWYLTALNFAKKITDIFKFIKGEQHEDTLRVLSYFANLLDFDKNHVEAEKIYRELLIIYKENSDDQVTHEVLAILNQLGVCLLNQDKYVESENIFREVLPRRERLNGKDHTTVFTCLNNLSLALQGLNKYKEAELYLRRSLEGRLKVNGPNDTKTFTSMLNLASCLDEQNINVEETEELYRKALKGREIQLGINHPRYLIALKFLNLFLDKHEKYEEAELYIRQLFELREKHLGLNHKDTLNSLNSLAYTLSQINKYDEAEKFYLLALERHEEVYGLNHSNTHVVTSNLAYLYLNYEKHEKAEIYFKNSLEICKNIYGSEHEDTLEELDNFIDFLEDKEDYKQADLLYNRLLKSTQSLHGNEHEETLRTKQNYAVFLRNNTKEIEKALKLLEEVLLIRRKENNSGDVSSVLTALGTTYSQKGLFDKAREAFLESINIRRKLYNDGDEDFKKPLISSLNRLLDLYQNNGQKEEMEKVELEIKNLSA